MYRYRVPFRRQRYILAYRFSTRDLEGFVGLGPSEDQAHRDAINQVGRKCLIIREIRRNGEEFEFGRVIAVPAGTNLVTLEEYRLLCRHWNTCVRY